MTTNVHDIVVIQNTAHLSNLQFDL